MSKITKKLSGRLNLVRKVMNSQSENIADLYGELCQMERTLKLHGEAHMAQDILPQFTALCKKVDAEISGNGKQMSQHILDHRENSALMDKRILALQDRMDVLESQGSHSCHNISALQEDRTRIIELEDQNRAALKAHGTRGLEIQIMVNRLNALEEGQNTMLKTIPEVEILKVKVAGIEQDNTRSYAVHHKEAFDAVYAKMKEQRSDYHGHIRQLVEENAEAHELIRKNASVAQECGNAQAHEILKMQEQIKGLETRLSRAQDLIAAMEDEKVDIWKPATRQPDRGCVSCLYGGNAHDEGPCRGCFPSEWPNWVSKTPLPLKGRTQRMPVKRSTLTEVKTVTPRRKKGVITCQNDEKVQECH